MPDLSALIERVEKLAGPSREVDLDVAIATGMVSDEVSKYGPHLRRIEARRVDPYTASLDAAGALVERVLPGCGLSVEHHPVYGDWWDAAIFDRIPKTIANARKKTAALAVCLAALRALQDQEGRDG